MVGYPFVIFSNTHPEKDLRVTSFNSTPFVDGRNIILDILYRGSMSPTARISLTAEEARDVATVLNFYADKLDLGV